MVGYVKELFKGTGSIYWFGQETKEFERGDVRAFGKSVNYNDFCTRFWVRLTDGTELHVKADRQSKDDEKWLRKLSKRAGFPGLCSKDLFQCFVWIDVTEGG